MKTENLFEKLIGTVFRLAVVVLVDYIIYNGVVTGYDYGYRIFREPAMTQGEGKTITVDIPEGMSPVAMGKLFESKGLVRDSRLFVLQYFCSEYRKDLKPGIYELNTSMLVEEMFEAMTETPEEEKDS